MATWHNISKLKEKLKNYKEIPFTFTEIPLNWQPIPFERVVIKEKIGGRDRLREQVKIRDNYTCQICGKVWEKGKRKFDVHHLDKELENNDSCWASKNFDRMITLCHKCHLNLRHIKEKQSFARRVKICYL